MKNSAIWTVPASASGHSDTEPIASNILYTRNRTSKGSEASEFFEEDFDEHCCHGRFNIKTALQVLALINLMWDGIAAYLTLEYREVSYIFAACFMISVLCLSSVISGVQQERKKLIRMATVCAALKAIALATLEVTACLAIFDEYLGNELFHLALEIQIMLLIIPLFVFTLMLQWQLGGRVYELIKLRDALYIIPSGKGQNEGPVEVAIGPQLRKQLEIQLKQNHVVTSPTLFVI